MCAHNFFSLGSKSFPTFNKSTGLVPIPNPNMLHKRRKKRRKQKKERKEGKKKPNHFHHINNVQLQHTSNSIPSGMKKKSFVGVSKTQSCLLPIHRMGLLRSRLKPCAEECTCAAEKRVKSNLEDTRKGCATGLS